MTAENDREIIVEEPILPIFVVKYNWETILTALYMSCQELRANWFWWEQEMTLLTRVALGEPGYWKDDTGRWSFILGHGPSLEEMLNINIDLQN